MSDRQPFLESQKLVRCDVVNRYNESSTRFVALDAFKLWEYLMCHKHGLRVGEPRLCLWVDEDAFQRGASVFERAGAVEPVDRVTVDLFDTEYGFSQTVTRYARTNETPQLVDILRSHIPPPLDASDACSIDIVHGQVVEKWHPNASRNILTGLEG
jgi:hypothetical protein